MIMKQTTARNADVAGRAERIHDYRDTEVMGAQTTNSAVQIARETWQRSRAAEAEYLQANSHLAIVDDTKGGVFEAPEAGSLTVPQIAYVSQSTLNEFAETVAANKRAFDRRVDAHDKQTKRAAVFTRACNLVDDALLAIKPREVLRTFESQHDLDDTTPEDVKAFFAEVTAAGKDIEHLGQMTAPISAEDIEVMVGEAISPLGIVSPTHAQKANALLGAGKPYLRWKRSAAASALTLGFGGVPADGASDALALAIWLNRDRVVEELRAQAAALAEAGGVLTPKEYRAKLTEAKAAKYLAELEASAAWWRCREAGFDTVPPPVSGRALLLIAPQ